MSTTAAHGGSLCIELRGIRALGVHGVLPHERSGPQPFSVDLDVWLAAATADAATQSDELEATVDYGDLVARVSADVSGTTFALLEALAARIADTAFDLHAGVEKVTVTVRKLRPPVPVLVDSVAVRLTRTRAEPAR